MADIVFENVSLQDFQQFSCNDHWKVGKKLRDDMPPGHGIAVSWLIVGGKAKFVIKAHAETSPDGPHTTWARPRSTPKDSFLLEAQAYERLRKYCPDTLQVFFPKYHGVARLTRVQYPIALGPLRSRGIVLEAIKSTSDSRRLLGETKISGPLADQIKWLSEEMDKSPLSEWEKKWYKSLTIDRLRRVAALHDVGIIHGDIRDDHFRLPDDFYDTVLYDFSSSKALTRSLYPKSQQRITEQRQILNWTLYRAERIDLRHHLATSLGVEPQTIEDFCTREIAQELDNLDLVIIKVSSRPDSFTTPSLASIFPFLEAVRPKHDVSWHIRTARLLEHYVCAWFFHTPEARVIKSLSFGEHLSDIHSLHISGEAKFLCVLFPKSWHVRKSYDLESACTRTSLSEDTGCVFSWEAFQAL